MNRKNLKTNVLMCGSKMSVKGGMVSVIKNYLAYEDWGDYNLIYVPTHTEKSKPIVALYFLFAYIRILFLLMFRNIKIAHFHTAERGSFYRKAYLVRLCKIFGVKTILHIHAAEFEEFYAGLNERKKSYVKRILELTDVNIVLSKRLISMVKDKAPNATVEVLYNAVNTYPENPYNKEAKNVLFLGRLGKRKGTYDLLEAIKLIDDKIPAETKFYLCGDGEIKEVTERVKALGIEHRIAHIGWTDGEQKKEFFANSCLNVLPSYNEGLPMTILETMAYGIPNISTNIASIPEVLPDGENGYLIEPGDINSLSNNIITLISKENLRVSFSNKCYELIENNFALDSNIGKLKEIYQSLS